MTNTLTQRFHERYDAIGHNSIGCGCLGFAIFALWTLATGTALLLPKIPPDDFANDSFLLAAFSLANGIFGAIIVFVLSIPTIALIAFLGSLLPSRPETTELHDAVRQADFARVERILNTTAGARLINRKTGTHIVETPLSCCLDNVHIARLLLAHGADPHIRIMVAGGATVTVLHELAKFATKDVMNAVLLHGANSNIRIGLSRQTPLHLAASYKNVGAAEALLDAGANVNAPDSMQQTPLHLACYSKEIGDPKRIAIVRLLLDRGAKVNLVDRDGHTPLALCVWECVFSDSVPSPSVLDELLDRGANVHVRLWKRSLTDYASQEEFRSRHAAARLIEILKGHR